MFSTKCLLPKSTDFFYTFLPRCFNVNIHAYYVNITDNETSSLIDFRVFQVFLIQKSDI